MHLLSRSPHTPTSSHHSLLHSFRIGTTIPSPHHFCLRERREEEGEEEEEEEEEKEEEEIVDGGRERERTTLTYAAAAHINRTPVSHVEYL